MNNFTNAGRVHSKLFRKLRLWFVGIRLSDKKNVSVVQLPAPPKSGRSSAIRSPLGLRISHILSMCSKPEMVVVTTPSVRRVRLWVSIIARMANLHPFRNLFSVKIFPSKPVSQSKSSPDSDVSISAAVYVPGPWPAVIRVSFLDALVQNFTNGKTPVFPRFFGGQRIMSAGSGFDFSCSGLTSFSPEQSRSFLDLVHDMTFSQSLVLVKKEGLS